MLVCDLHMFIFCILVCSTKLITPMEDITQHSQLSQTIKWLNHHNMWHFLAEHNTAAFELRPNTWNIFSSINSPNSKPAKETLGVYYSPHLMLDGHLSFFCGNELVHIPVISYCRLLIALNSCCRLTGLAPLENKLPMLFHEVSTVGCEGRTLYGVLSFFWC